jgi:hypothetical protein
MTILKLDAPSKPAMPSAQPVRLTKSQREVLAKLENAVIIEWWTPSNTAHLLFPSQGAWKSLQLYRRIESTGNVNARVFNSLLEYKLIIRKRSQKQNHALLAHYEITDLGRAALGTPIEPKPAEPTNSNGNVARVTEDGTVAWRKPTSADEPLPFDDDDAMDAAEAVIFPNGAVSADVNYLMPLGVSQAQGNMRAEMNNIVDNLFDYILTLEQRIAALETALKGAK